VTSVAVAVAVGDVLAIRSDAFVLVVFRLLFGVHAPGAGTVQFVLFGTQTPVTSQRVHAIARRRTHGRLLPTLVDVCTRTEKKTERLRQKPDRSSYRIAHAGQ